MTVTVTGDIADATGQPDSRDWEAWSPVYRAGTDTVVTMRPQPVRVVGGQFVGEFEPGPVLLKNPEGQQFYITVPDADANLGDLIAVATGVPPDTGADLLAAAVETFVENNPGYPWTGLAGRPSALAAGANQPNGYLALGSDGKADAAQLPSYVDDVVEYANQAAFPGTGTSGKIFVALDTGDSFRWSGSAYVRISDRVTASGITDSTSTGRAVVTATDQAAARAAIGAGTSSLTIGTSGSTAKAGDYQPAAANISDSTSTGRAVITATDALTARDALSAATRRRARTALTEGVIKGGNITVKPSGASWAGLWSEWDWANWIQPQVDRAIKLGLNAIRVIGAPQVVLLSGTGSGAAQISQATYDGHWKQLAEYCMANGLRFYPCLTEKWAFYNLSTYSFQDSTATTSITTTAGVLAAYQNVIGFDLFQEGSGSADGLVLADILALYAAVRAAAPGVPLTTSNSSGGFGSAAAFWADSTSLSYQAWTADGGSDFADIHIYLEGSNAADVDGFTDRTKKPILIGEYGAGQDLAADANRIARYTSARLQHNRPGVLGSFVWALADQGTTNPDKYGVWDNTGFSQGVSPLSTTSGQRSVLVTELRKFVTAPTPSPSFRSPNLLTVVQSNPTGSASGWSQGTNTYLTATNLGLAVAATAAGNVLAATVPTNGTAVLGTTPYLASVTVLAGGSYSAKPVTLQIDWYDSSNAYISSSPLTHAIDSTTSPLPITVLRISPSNAAYAVLVFRGYGFAANEAHLLINCSLRQYGAGETPASSYPVAGLPSGEAQLFGAPSGALWTSIDRTQVAISGSLGLLTSGTPRAVLAGFAVPTLVTGLKFLTGSTAAVSPTHWWVVATDTAGNVLAVSADQTSTAIAASSVITVPFTTPTVLPAGNVYFHLMVAAGTVPTVAGISSLLNTPAINPVFSGASTATGQTTPPSVGGTLAGPSSQSSSMHWCWAY